MSLQSKRFNTYLQRFIADHPSIEFVESPSTYWDPKKQQIHYNPRQKNPVWALLHEIGHMQQNHSNYQNDIELLIMEKDAWKSAVQLGEGYDFPIDRGHIEDCLDSYRDWLHKRSSCPNCHQTGIQTNSRRYTCLNCHESWEVSVSRFCRSYRRSIKKSSV